ncbi:MAG: serine/threonine-protein kinase [Verrucomicrobiota bacterium]
MPITEFCDKNKLPARERMRLFIQVSQAIQSAHQKGIIHRDIKPSNVLVTLHHGEPMPKVIDFGIAKATNQKLTEKTLFTQYAMMIGTPAYMSPEQAEMSSMDVDTRTDVYSLGVLLYELLTGSTPFPEKRLRSLGYGEMQRVIMEEEPERPSTRLSTLTNEQKSAMSRDHGEEFVALSKLLKGDLDWIVMKCLEKDRTRRYETANGLATDIQRHLQNEPVIARPPSTAYRFQKAWRRNKLVFEAGTAVVAALLFGVIVSTWQATVATRAKNQATRAEADRAEEARKAQAERDNAKAAEARAQTARILAETSRQHSRRLLYASDMNLAQQSLKLNNLGRARWLLDQHRPRRDEVDLRGWEWRYLWQLTRGDALVTLTNRPTQGFSVTFSTDGKRLAVGWWDGRVDLWDVPAQRWVRALTERELPHPARVAFSSAPNLLAATSGLGAVTLYDLGSGRESILWQVTDSGGWDVRDLVFSQDGSKLVVYAGSNPEAGDAVWVVDVASARIESRHPTGRSAKSWSHIGAARISPDNRRIYLVRTVAWSGRIQCIDLATRQELWQTHSQDDPLVALDISPDGRVLASASGFVDKTIHLWNTATGELLKTLAGHTASVIDLAFTQDGRRLISAAVDQTIRFWDTSTWTQTQVLRGHTDELWAIATSEAAQLIASAGKDGSLMLWRMDEKRAADWASGSPVGDSRRGCPPADHSRVLLLPWASHRSWWISSATPLRCR